MSPTEDGDLLWLKILNTDILHLPQWNDIQYKLRSKDEGYEIIGDKWVAYSSRMRVTDGTSYIVQISDNKAKNEIKYSNPKAYLKYYPNVDELVAINELLEIIANCFIQPTSN